MRTRIVLGFSLAVAVLLAGCGERREEAATPEAGGEPLAQPAPVVPPPPPDESEELSRALAELGAQPQEQGLAITLPSADFATGSAAYDPAQAPVLERVVQVLTEHPDARLLVVGHTDSRGDASANERLARQRAEAVRDQLVSRGVSAERIGLEAAGESRPVAGNDTEEGRRANRRVELVFPKNERLAGAADTSPEG